MSELTVYMNGDFVSESQARISVLDHSFLYGDGVFEGISVDGGRIYKLEEHVSRLEASALYLRIVPPLTHEQMVEAIARVVAVNDLRDGYVRPILTRGTGPMGIDATRTITEPNLVIIPQVRPRLSDEQRLDVGLGAKVAGLRRTPPDCLDPRVKSNNYLNLILAKFEAWDAGVDVAILLDTAGYVAETAGQNIFVVRDGALITPPVYGVLAGITRQTILTLQGESGEPALEQPLTLYDLFTADEVFVTATLIEVAAITSIDGRRIGAGTAGPVTRDLLGRLRQAMQQDGYVVDFGEAAAS
jgi:branched-chain amino acid aminotransferase